LPLKSKISKLEIRRRASFTGTKCGGGGKIGIGKQGRAKIPSPQPPSPAPEQVRYGTSLFARPSV